MAPSPPLPLLGVLMPHCPPANWRSTARLTSSSGGLPLRLRIQQQLPQRLILAHVGRCLAAAVGGRGIRLALQQQLHCVFESCAAHGGDGRKRAALRALTGRDAAVDAARPADRRARTAQARRLPCLAAIMRALVPLRILEFTLTPAQRAGPVCACATLHTPPFWPSGAPAHRTRGTRHSAPWSAAQLAVACRGERTRVEKQAHGIRLALHRRKMPSEGRPALRAVATAGGKGCRPAIYQLPAVQG